MLRMFGRKDSKRDEKISVDLLRKSASKYHCGIYLYNLCEVDRQGIYQDLEGERLECKKREILDTFYNNEKSWNQTLYIFLLRAISDMSNKDAYAELSHTLPLSILQSERRDLKNVEALILAASGLIFTLPRDDFSRQMEALGVQLLEKYNIQPMRPRRWRRYQGSLQLKDPLARLLQVARIIHNVERLFTHLASCRTRDDIFSLFNVEVAGDWMRYFRFDRCSLGMLKCDLIGINLVVPMLQIYGEYIQSDDIISSALELAELLPVERNTYIRRWSERGLVPQSSFETQALIQLAREYCHRKRCSECIVYQHMCSERSVLPKMPDFIERLGK